MAADFPVAIRDKALSRIKAQCAGNGIDANSIQIEIREDACDAYTANLWGFVTVESDIRPAKRRVKNARKAGQIKTLDDPKKLKQEAEKLHKKAISDQALQDRLAQASMEGTIGKEDFDIPGYSAFYEIAKTCHDCNGAGQTQCPQCQGRGQSTCPQCQGQRQQLCWNCQGQGFAQNSNGTRQGCHYCHGTGRLSCQLCNGGGIVNCKQCGGQKQTKCSGCGGHGQLVDYAEAILRAKIDWHFEPIANSNEEIPPLLARTVIACGPLHLIKSGEMKAQKQIGQKTVEAENEENVSRETKEQMQLCLGCEIAFAEAKINIGAQNQHIVVLGEKGRIQNFKPILREKMQKLMMQLSQARKRRSTLVTALKRYRQEAFFKRAIALLNDYPPRLAMARFYKEHDLLFEKNQVQPFFKLLHKSLRNVTGKRGKALPILGGTIISGAVICAYFVTQILQTAHLPGLSIISSFISDIGAIIIGGLSGTYLARFLDRFFSSKALQNLGLPSPKKAPILTPYGPIIFFATILVYALCVALNIGGELPIWLRAAFSTALI